MINDGDYFGSFGFDDLDSRDLGLIESADLVDGFNRPLTLWLHSSRVEGT
jgi:hypothetical protein